jgi:signal transduction histidine kinase
MRLSDFIRSETEAILVEWEAFAASLLPGAQMSSLALRDHAAQILEAVALDVATPQTTDAQAEKSKGRAPEAADAGETAAQTHAILRLRSGFGIRHLAAEYRALRASVLRLWAAKCHPEPIHAEDAVRFNEAIDQALAESIDFFTTQDDRNRDLLLGMLSHDMRSPLNSVMLTAQYLGELNAGAEISESAAVIIRGGAAMKALLDDLLDYNRAKLGGGISVTPSDVDLERVFRTEVDLQRHAHPQRRIELHVEGITTGHWDGARLQQVLRNLLSNALQYGREDAPITVSLRGAESVVFFEVKNHGPTIDAAAREDIFEPLRRGPSGKRKDGSRANLGLGLFIVREVVKAHGARVEVRSADEETAFAVHLPRRAIAGRQT